MMMGHVVVVNTDLACSVVLSASQFVCPHSVPRQRPSCSSLLGSWGLDLDGEGPRVDCELGLGVNSVVSAVFTDGVSTTVFSAT
jgi:hypothetical protein